MGLLGTIRNTFNSSTNQEDVGGGFFFSGNGSNSILSDFFGTDVFNEEEMTPHNEMMRVREMIDNNAFIASGLSTYQSIFLGDEVNVESEDAETRQFFNDEWLPESNLVNAMANGGVGEHFKGIGNAYYHVQRGEATGIPKKVELIAKPDNMWIRKNSDGSVKDYILEVPNEIRDHDNPEKNYETFTVSYGGTAKDTVIGIRYEPEEIIHVPQGMHQVPPYGRADLASASSDEKILREIERSYGVIARHKQVPKKIISLYKEMDGDQMPLSSEEYEEKLDHLNSLRDTDNPVWNNVKADIEDYSYGSENIKMQETIDYLKRKITSPVIPQFMIHGDMTTNAVSNDQLAVFFQEVRGDRHSHVQKFNELLQEVARRKGLSEDVTLSFGDLELDTEQSKKQRVVNRWQKGLITLNEARDMLGLPEDEEFQEDPYKWEVSNQPSPAAVQQTLRDVVDDE